jgi:flagellar hook-associated protein 3 FlgL
VAKEYEDTLIYLPDSGELVLGSNLATNLTSEAATLNVDYYKEGFSVGETRPEMYFNCTNKTDASRNNWITYTNYDEDHNWIAQNINYTVANNQELAINTQIHDVVDADCYRDLAEMTDIVQDAIDAHTTVSNIENMLKSTEYADEESQNYLKDCLEKANKQMAYMDDHLQKVFSAQITNFENYQNKVNLAITNNGTKGDQLSLTENRMSSQQTTFKELKSNNEDEELSDVTIDYTAAYTAFQASLQAAGKIDDMSLLDYL